MEWVDGPTEEDVKLYLGGIVAQFVGQIEPEDINNALKNAAVLIGVPIETGDTTNVER